MIYLGFTLSFVCSISSYLYTSFTLFGALVSLLLFTCFLFSLSSSSFTLLFISMTFIPEYTRAIFLFYFITFSIFHWRSLFLLFLSLARSQSILCLLFCSLFFSSLHFFLSASTYLSRLELFCLPSHCIFVFQQKFTIESNIHLVQGFAFYFRMQSCNCAIHRVKQRTYPSD